MHPGFHLDSSPEKPQCVNQKSNNTKMQIFFSSCKYSATSTVGLCLNWGLQKYFLGLEASPVLLPNQWTSPEAWAHAVFSLIFPRKPFELALPGADVPPFRSRGRWAGVRWRRPTVPSPRGDRDHGEQGWGRWAAFPDGRAALKGSEEKILSRDYRTASAVVNFMLSVGLLFSKVWSGAMFKQPVIEIECL